MEFTELAIGDRVELGAHTDLWMMGARFAHITGKRDYRKVSPTSGELCGIQIVRVRPDRALYHGAAARRSYWMVPDNIHSIA